MKLRRSKPVPAKRPAPLRFVDGTHVRVGRRTLLYFAGCNYLGLSRHPRVLEAMAASLREGSVQPGASRATTGDHAAFREAERELARFFRHPSAALLPCGYMAPLAAIQALRDRTTHILLDDTAHGCGQDAARLSGLPVIRFSGGSSDALAWALGQLTASARPLILTDGTFGTRGGGTPVDAYLARLPQRGLLLVDDAHGAGAVGPGGRGILAHVGLSDPRIILTLSLAKAVGVAGGAVLGTADIVESVRSGAPAFVGTTSLPLGVPAGIVAALRVIRAEPERLRSLHRNIRQFHELMAGVPGVQSSSWTPVTAIHPTSPSAAARLSRSLLAAGIHPPFIRYLSGPSTGFFRFALSAEHSPEDIGRLAGAIRALR